jgi:hypothetical protein
MEIYDFHNEDELVYITKAEFRNKLWAIGVFGAALGFTAAIGLGVLFLVLSDTIMLIEVQ